MVSTTGFVGYVTRNLFGFSITGNWNEEVVWMTKLIDPKKQNPLMQRALNIE